ncbi:MAG: NAD(+) synthase [Clostridiales bacterium]|nr:NAD(+) synthase [Clostridiales bacterium]
MQEMKFNAAAVRDRLVELVRKLAREQGFSRVIVGISGGKDSTVSAAICARALGRENVYGVMLPDGRQADIQDSVRVCEALGIRKKTVNIGPMHQALREATDLLGENVPEGDFPVPFVPYSNFNVGPRLRMTTLRYIGQALGARLVGTGNLSEITVGYCTKDGDMSCDFSLLGALTSVEVVEVGLSMDELPRELVVKPPADGLTGKTDEEQMGLRYQDIHLYIRQGTCGDPEMDDKIRLREKNNMHKRRLPLVLDPFAEKE